MMAARKPQSGPWVGGGDRPRHTAETLTQEFWSRCRPGEFMVKLTVRQVGWLVSLLHDMDRQMVTRQRVYTLPVAASRTPLALVVYPNGAGFIKVEDFAMDYNHDKRQWRIKAEYA